MALPFRGLPGDQQLPGSGVTPLDRHVRHVAREDVLLKHLACRRADDLPSAGQDHREDQPDEDGLAAAVLQEQDRRGRRPAERIAAQVQRDVLIPGASRSNGVEADAGQLIHR